MSEIVEVHGREILDSRGNPTVEADVRLASGATPRRAVVGWDSGRLAMILAVLEAMHDFFKDPRYRPSPWLTRRAKLGVSLLTPE